MKYTRIIALALILALTLPVAAQELPPKVHGIYELDALPESWNPLEELTAEGELLLELTMDRLYLLSPDGQTLTPSLAENLPEDVSAQYGLADSLAYRIALRPGSCWEDGDPITADDLIFAIHRLIDCNVLGLNLSGLQDYYYAREKVSSDIVSLDEAGFATVEEAESAGHSRFYVDVGHFWGLDAGWVSADDRTRIRDEAIPTGITEMYVSGAYLYDRYLQPGASQSFFQSRFVGVARNAALTERGDIGIIRESGSSLVLIFDSPVSARYLALKLSRLPILPEKLYADNYGTSQASYRACGPYRIASVSDSGIVLVPNVRYQGAITGFEAEQIILKRIGT